MIYTSSLLGDGSVRNTLGKNRTFSLLVLPLADERERGETRFCLALLLAIGGSTTSSGGCKWRACLLGSSLRGHKLVASISSQLGRDFLPFLAGKVSDERREAARSSGEEQ